MPRCEDRSDLVCTFGAREIERLIAHFRSRASFFTELTSADLEVSTAARRRSDRGDLVLRGEHKLLNETPQQRFALSIGVVGSQICGRRPRG